MNVYAHKGDQVVFLGENGYELELTQAHKFLKTGKVYTVLRTEVYEWHSYVWLQEIPQVPFNTVQFEDLVEKVDFVKEGF